MTLFHRETINSAFHLRSERKSYSTYTIAYLNNLFEIVNINSPNQSSCSKLRDREKSVDCVTIGKLVKEIADKISFDDYNERILEINLRGI